MNPCFHTLLHAGLVLRPWQVQDAESFVQAAHESTATVGQWMDWCTPAFSQQNALDWFAQCRDKAARFQAYEVGVFSADDGRLLGGAALNHIDHDNRRGNLGYWVRQGIALRAAQALVAHAFTTLQLQRIEIVVAQGNTASEALARQTGAQWECLARNRLQLHGAPVAAHVFSIIPG